jgi:hypothetical protein
VNALDQAGNLGGGTGQITLLHDNGEDDKSGDAPAAGNGRLACPRQTIQSNGVE